MRVSRRLAAAALVLVLAAGFAACTSRQGDGDGDASAGKGRRSTSTTSVDGSPGGGDASEPGGAAPGDATGTTTEADLFRGATTEPPVPEEEFEVTIGGAATGTASGAASTRCLQGRGYFDVDIAPNPPLPAGGGLAVTSMVFGAPGFRGPGSYDAARADDAEWSVGLVETETGDPSEYYSPLNGASGTVTIDDDGRSGSFDIRGLVDDEGNTLSAKGRFTCGVVER